MLIIRTSLLRHLQAGAVPLKHQPGARKDNVRLYVTLCAYVWMPPIYKTCRCLGNQAVKHEYRARRDIIK